MAFQEKLEHEIKAVTVTTLYFVMWLGVLVTIKVLILDEYQIRIHGVSAVLFGALVLAKVVLILEHVNLGEWIRRRPALTDVILRTTLYALGVLVVLLLEKAFEGRHEHSGFIPSLLSVFQHVDIYHVWVNTICVTGSLLFYNVLSVIRRHVEGGLLTLLQMPLPEEPKEKNTHDLNNP